MRQVVLKRILILCYMPLHLHSHKNDELINKNIKRQMTIEDKIFTHFC